MISRIFLYMMTVLTGLVFIFCIGFGGISALGAAFSFLLFVVCLMAATGGVNRG